MLHKLGSSDQKHFVMSHFESNLFDLPALNFHFPSKNKLTCQYPKYLWAFCDVKVGFFLYCVYERLYNGAKLYTACIEKN